MTILLASKSPRRQNLLRQVGVLFEVIEVDVDENNINMPPIETALANAEKKASAALNRIAGSPGALVIGADTIVVCNGKIFGKPKDKKDAVNILTELSGKEHQVITGVAVAQKDKLWTDFAITKVGFRHLSSKDIEKYVQTGEPLDKAGAYGIQEKGILLVEYINGCYTNVVGLPLVTLFRIFVKAGVSIC